MGKPICWWREASGACPDAATLGKCREGRTALVVRGAETLDDTDVVRTAPADSENT